MSQYCKNVFFSLLVIILSGFSLDGCCDTQHDFQTWLNLTITGRFNKESNIFSHFKYWLEGQERVGEDSSYLSQSLLRTGIGYIIG